jgi:transcriptional regulator with XRE-family HTH domain
MEPSILGKRIAQARKQREWTQEQLCREAKVALNTVARLEQV